MSQIKANYPDLQDTHIPDVHKRIKTIGLWSSVVFNSVVLGYVIMSITANGFDFDSAITQYSYSFHSPLVTHTFEVVTTFGYSLLIVLIVILVLYLIFFRDYTTAVWVACTTALGGQFNSALKLLISRPRPQQIPLISTNGYSFPSGHAMAALILYGLVLYLVLEVYSDHFSYQRKVATIVLCVGLIFLVGASRVYLGVHYPSDVLGGYVAGCLWLSGAILIHQQLPKKILPDAGRIIV